MGQNNDPSNLGTVGIPAADADPVVNYRNYIALAVPYNDLFYSDTSGCDPDDGTTFKFDRERPPPDANGIRNFASWSARELETEFNTDDDWDGCAHDANESVNGENPFFYCISAPVSSPGAA